jgi:hypothetical protein
MCNKQASLVFLIGSTIGVLLLAMLPATGKDSLLSFLDDIQSRERTVKAGDERGEAQIQRSTRRCEQRCGIFRACSSPLTPAIDSMTQQATQPALPFFPLTAPLAAKRVVPHPAAT